MIEINLSPSKSGGEALNFGGFDLSQLNVKMIIFGILFLYIPESILSNYYEGEVSNLSNQEVKLSRSLRKAKGKLKGLDNIKKQVDALKNQEKRLAERLSAVKIIINKRQNPFKVLSYIADNTPKTVWLNSIVLEDKKIVMGGNSENWKDIGVFLEALKNSIFFSNIQYKVPENAKTDFNGRKVEVFEITSELVRFQ